MINAVLIGFGVLAIVIGAIPFIVQFRQGLRADASKKWPTASGTVTACALEQLPGHDHALDLIGASVGLGDQHRFPSKVSLLPGGR